MVDLLANFREIKDFNLRKLLFISTFILFSLAYIRKVHGDFYNDFLKTLAYFAKEVHFEKWKSITSIIQLLFAEGIVFCLLAVIFFIVLRELIYKKIWRKLRI